MNLPLSAIDSPSSVRSPSGLELPCKLHTSYPACRLQSSG